MSATVLSRVCAGLLIAIFAATAGLAIWRDQVSANDTNSAVSAQTSSNLYNEAKSQADKAVGWAVLYDATGDPAMLEQQLIASEELGSVLTTIAFSGHPGDAEFGLWMHRYLVPLADVFSKLGSDNATLEEITAAYMEAYTALYQSILAGDLGDATIAERLPDPANWEEDPNSFANPIAVVVEAMAVRRETEAKAGLGALVDRANAETAISSVLFGAGTVLTVALVGLMYVTDRRALRLRTEANTFRRVATTDPLTGLGNVRGFEESLQAVGATGHGADLSLVMMDLDGFKLVNDSFGHARGDEVLKAFAGVVAEVSPPGTGRFRIGGDEFALILHGRGVEPALAAAETIRSLAQERLGHGVTVSLGAAAVTVGAGFDAALLRQKADAALYTAKLNGRNVAIAYEADEAQHPLFPTAKLRAVRELLVEGRIEPVFQPIWDIRSHSLLGYEGLSRPHADYGLEGPQEAFDIAEHFGHAADLDQLCRRHILAAAGSLPGSGIIFVNVSPYTLANHAFSAQLLLDELVTAGIPPSRVVFEITEQSRVSIDVVAAALRSLTGAGLRVAVDDVGAGNNGLMLLSRVPFEFVKIDRSVIVSAIDGGAGRGALMAILAFASESGAHVVAEGVEDSEMFSVVREFADKQIKGNPGLIHSVQGFYFGRPQPAPTIEREGAQRFPAAPDTDIAAA